MAWADLMIWEYAHMPRPCIVIFAMSHHSTVKLLAVGETSASITIKICIKTSKRRKKHFMAAINELTLRQSGQYCLPPSLCIHLPHHHLWLWLRHRRPIYGLVEITQMRFVWIFIALNLCGGARYARWIYGFAKRETALSFSSFRKIIINK